MAPIVQADIINVPDDHETIQAGIDAADDGDTVLVQPGEYVENINFDGKAIAVASLMLTTGDRAYIDSTIIDGDHNGSVVQFVSGEGQATNLVGFTIRNGEAESGGGVYIDNESAPRLRHLIIRENDARFGAGIRADDSQLTIEDVEITENEGNTVHINSCNIALRYVSIHSNSCRNVFIVHIGRSRGEIENTAIVGNNINGAGVVVYFYVVPDLVLRNVTIANNEPERGVNLGIETSSFGRRTHVTLVNTIIWDNFERSISMGSNDEEPPEADNLLAIRYSDIQGGANSIHHDRWLNWGDGNIDADPLFIDPENGDYRLTPPDSPCIDTGDPESDLDPDGTRADIGVFSFFQGGTINGFVFDLQDEQPLEGTVVSTSYGAATVTDDEGYWQIDPLRMAPFDLTASIIGYFDSTITDLQVEIGDTLSITFSLLHAELEPSIESIRSELLVGEREQFDFSIHNSGNGVLDWSVETRYRGNAGHDSWELRQSYPFGQQLDESRLYGVLFIDSLFYVSGSNDSNPTIYILDKDGGLINTFAQPGDDIRGMKDLTFDGELIWGAAGNIVYGMTIEGEVETSFEAPYNPSTAITWDSDREILWISGITSDPVGMDRDGNRVEGMEIDRDGRRIYGLAYFPEDSDNAPLYIFYKERETNRQALVRHNFETGETVFITYLEPEAGGSPQGAYITNKFDVYSWVFMSVAVDADRDRVDIWQLDANTSWSLVDPSEGTVNPATEQEIILIIDAAELAPLEYPAELLFRHNGFGLETAIPIDLTVSPSGVEDPKEGSLPRSYAITGAYPNPFNSTVRLNFTVPLTSQVSIKLYNITSSLIEKIADGDHQPGHHSVTWDGSDISSGIYFARMETIGFSQTVKLMLMK